MSAPNPHCVSAAGDKLAIGGGIPAEDGQVIVISWPESRTVSILQGHDDSVRAVSWSSGLKLLSASIDRHINLWDTNQPKEPIGKLNGHSRSVNALCTLVDRGLVVSGGDDNSVRVWDISRKTLVRSMNQHTKPVLALARRPADSSLPMVASAAEDRTIRLWQPTIGRMVRYVRLPAVPLTISWRNSQQIIAGCDDGKVRLVDANEVKVLRALDGVDGWVYATAVHPIDGRCVIAGSGGEVRMLEIE